MPVDEYLPRHGNRGYRISRYELDLDYRVASKRLTAQAALTAVATTQRPRFSLDLAVTMTVSRVLVNGVDAANFSHVNDKLIITPTEPIPAGAAVSLVVHYAGIPAPVPGPTGEVGWSALDDSVLVTNQPNGASSWFPCDDHPHAKASHRFSITLDTPHYVLANGTLLRKTNSGGLTTWVYEQPEPMATYLASVQIGPYTKYRLNSAQTGVPMYTVLAPRRRAAFENDFARQPQMMQMFSTLFGTFPFPGYTVVITEGELPNPIPAQGVSVFGTNHCDGRRGAERLLAQALATQWFGCSLTIARWRDIWLVDGFARYAEWLWSENNGGLTTEQRAHTARAELEREPTDTTLGDPGPEHLNDPRIGKRGALLLHALRAAVGDTAFFELLREWSVRRRYGSVSTEEFTDLAGHYSPTALRPLWQQWLTRAELPDLPVTTSRSAG